jgi:aspartate-semialdehyde dehydrogenase
MDRNGAYRVAVVGATGQVGRLMFAVLRERRFPASEIVPFASERSAGRELDGLGAVRPLTDETIQGFDIALFSAGGRVSGEWAPRFAEAGAIVIDNSSRWRMDETVPLVVSEVNPHALDALAARAGRGAIVANPNCSTMQMVVALRPLHDEAAIERLVISTYQAVSGTGKAAVEELAAEAASVLAARSRQDGEAGAPVGTSPSAVAPSVYPHQIAFNALPHAGSFPPGDDHTDEERKLINETRKILGDPSIRVSATCVRVPVFVGHSEAVNVQTRDAISPERARELLEAAPGVAVLDDPANAVYPLATLAAGRDDVLVGRIRRDPGNERAIDMFIVADNLRKGAATNAVQIAEILHERGLVKPGAAAAA